jgi:hypothetical protein
VEPIRSEIPGWVLVGLGVSSAEPLPAYRLVADPEVLRAARLMLPSRAHAHASDHWWFPARLITQAHSYAVEAQLVVQPETGEGLRVRFPGRDRPAGMRELELEPAVPERHVRDLVARETATRVGLLTAPGGFAQLRINGSDSRLVHWREGNSAAMLQRLGLAEGEVFRATVETARGHADARLPSRYSPTLERRAPRAQAGALSHLIELVRSADDARFRGEIGSVVDLGEVLAWDAISQVFASADDAAVPAPDWYFDPVSGLLRPIVRTLVPSGGEREVPADAQRLVSRLLEMPALRAQRDALLRDWVGVTRSAQLETADERLGQWASRVAAGDATFARPRQLARLAQVRRTTRGALRARVEGLRQQLASGAGRFAQASVPAAAAELPDVAAWIERSGLALQTRGDALVLPAGTHHVRQTLVVPASHRLVIEPGALLIMAPDASLLTFRPLEAVGTREAPIEIRALDPKKPWGSIGIARAPESSELAYVTVSGGSQARFEGIEFAGQLAFNASDVVIRDSDVRGAHGDDALSVRRGFFQVARTRFIDNAADGFDAEWSTGSIEQSLFANNGDDGLDLATSEVRVHRGWFRRMGDKAISAGERSRVAVIDSRLVDSQIAIASKEDSRVEVESSEFRRNEIGVSLYRDNRVFGSGYGTISGGLFAENLRDFAVETGSGLTLNGVERLERAEAGVVIGFRGALDSAPSALP